jgi:hypothetical protein
MGLLVVGDGRALEAFSLWLDYLKRAPRAIVPIWLASSGCEHLSIPHTLATCIVSSLTKARPSVPSCTFGPGPLFVLPLTPALRFSPMLRDLARNASLLPLDVSSAALPCPTSVTATPVAMTLGLAWCPDGSQFRHSRWTASARDQPDLQSPRPTARLLLCRPTRTRSGCRNPWVTILFRRPARTTVTMNPLTVTPSGTSLPSMEGRIRHRWPLGKQPRS